MGDRIGEERTNAMSCPTKLLDDLPADRDEFGSHQKVADAIAELVRNEEGGKAIALIGPWGSGKSTIVNLLRKKLEEREDTFVFVFDAWAHRGDPLRRSFLECLINRLLDKGWLENKEENKREFWECRTKRLVLEAWTKLRRINDVSPSSVAIRYSGEIIPAQYARTLRTF
jgi:predicted transcriptional regulator